MPRAIARNTDSAIELAAGAIVAPAIARTMATRDLDASAYAETERARIAARVGYSAAAQAKLTERNIERKATPNSAGPGLSNGTARKATRAPMTLASSNERAANLRSRSFTLSAAGTSGATSAGSRSISSAVP